MAHLLHATEDGDRWDSLAQRYYNDVTQQRVLIAANREQFAGLSVPAILSAGLVIKVPLLDSNPVITTRQLPPWKQAAGQKKQGKN